MANTLLTQPEPEVNHQFTPNYSPEFIRNAIESYKQSPDSFKPDFLDDIKTHADHFKMDFNTDPNADDFGLASMVKQAGSGFVEGFTTLEVGKAPQNEYEGIARSLGHLAGFVGFVPNVFKGIKGAEALSQAIPKLKGMSVPMLGASAVQKKVNSVAQVLTEKAYKYRGEASKDVLDFLTQPLVKDIVQGGFHLGTASAISSWRGGVDDMMTAFMHGGVTGGVFRGIGNSINSGNEMGDKALKSLVASLYEGIPSTVRGDTTPEQIYSYVLGAYFGFNETPWEKRLADKYTGKMLKENVNDPELLPEWERLHPREKEVIKEMSDTLLSQHRAVETLNEFFRRQKDLLGEDVSVEEYEALLNSSDPVGNINKLAEAKIQAKYNPDFIGVSGGNAMERWFGKIADSVGLRMTHFRTPQEEGLKETGIGEVVKLRNSELPVADTFVEKAMNEIGIRVPTKGTLEKKIRRHNLYRKEYFRVRDVDQVIVVAPLGSGYKPPNSIDGLTMKLAQNMGKDVYVFNDANNKKGGYTWYKSEGGGGFKKVEKPTLESSFSISGIVKPSKAGKGALKNLMIRSGFDVPIEEIKPVEPEIGAEQSIDPGETVKILPTRRTERFVREHIKDTLEGETAGEINRKVIDITKELEIRMDELIEPENLNNSSKIFVDELSEKYNKQFSEDVYDGFRQIFKRRIEDSQIQHVSFIDTDGTVETLDTKNPVTRNSNSKTQLAPRFVMEKIYDNIIEEHGLSRTFEDYNEKPVQILDHIIMRDATGRTKEVTFSEYIKEKTSIIRDQATNPVERSDAGIEAKEEYIEAMAKVERAMDKKDMHYFGGSGDNERNYYVKYHPILNESNTKSLWHTLKNNVKGVEKTFREDLEEYKEKHKWMEEADVESWLKKQYLSNALWDVSLNGFSLKTIPRFEHTVFEKGLNAIMGGHYVGNKKGVIDFNKRQQIWFTNGYSIDGNFVRETLRNKYKLDNLVDMGDKGAGVNVVFVKDAAGSKVIKDFRGKAVGADKFEEATDGGILVNTKLLQAQNKESGHDVNGGFQKSFIVSPHEELGALLGKYAMHDAGPELSRYMDANNIHYMIYDSSAKQRGGRKIYELDENGLKGYETKNEVWARENIDSEQLLREHEDIKAEFEHWVTTPQWSKKLNREIIRKDNFFIRNPTEAEIKQGIQFVDEYNADSAALDFVTFKDYLYNENSGLFSYKRDVKLISPAKGIEDVMYQVPLKDVKVMMGVLSNNHMIDNAMTPKQMLTSLTGYTGDPAMLKLVPKVVRDMHATLILKSFKGTEDMNKAIAEFQKLDGDSLVIQEKLLENLDNINVETMFKMFRDPKYADFTAKAYSKILELNTEYIEGLIESGEINSSEGAKIMNENVTFDSSIDRMLSLGGGDISVINHKNVRHYVQKALRNYVVKRATRPKMPNSGTAYLRPYDPYIKKMYPELNTNSKLFLLDKGWKKKVIYDDFLPNGKLRLDKIWEKYKSGDLSEKEETKYKEILEAVNARIPMDSVSGAQLGTFHGFTDRLGYGIVLHPEKMRALGGADLDGDKAFVFFNMPKEWKEVYNAQREEHYTKDSSGNLIFQEGKDDKEMVDLFTEGTPEEVEKRFKHKAATYSPVRRKEISDNQATGRKVLGPAVVAKQVAVAAHSEIANMVNKDGVKGTTDWIDTFDSNGNKTGSIRATARVTPEELANAKKISRAAVAFPLDPMDFAGLKTAGHYQEQILDAHFKYEFKGVKKKNGKAKKEASAFEKKQAIFQDYHEMNSALFGKNFKEGRKWTYYEILEKLKVVKNKSEGARDTILPRIAELVEKIKWHEDILERVDVAGLKKMYEDYLYIKENYEYLEGPMQRYFPVKWQGERGLINVVLKEQLYKPENMRAFIHNEGKWNLIDKFFPKELKSSKFKKKKLTPETKIRMIENIVNQTRDFIINDMSDIIGIKLISKYAKNESPEKIKEIHEKTEEIKRLWSIANKEMQEIADGKTELKDASLGDVIKALNSSKELELNQQEYKELIDMSEKLEKRDGKAIQEGEKLSNTLNQNEADRLINEAKSELSQNQKDLFDSMMVTGFGRGDLERIKEVINLADIASGKKERLLDLISSRLIDKASRTYSLKVGFNSPEVSDKVIAEYLNEYKKQFKKADLRDSVAELGEEIQEAVSFKENINIDGVKTEVQMFESEHLRNKVKDLITDRGPRKLSEKEHKMVDELLDNVSHFTTINSGNINGLFRFLTNKDMASANMYDIGVFNKSLKSIKTGTWWQALTDSIKKGDKGPLIRKWHWMMFPEAINRDLMRRHIDLYEEGGFFLADAVLDPRKLEVYSGKIYRPASAMHGLTSSMHGSMENAMAAFEDKKNKFNEELSFLNSLQEERVGGIPIGEMIEKIGIRKMELRYANTLTDKNKALAYQNHWNEVKKYYTGGKYNIKNREFNILVKNEEGKSVRKSLTGEELVEKIDQHYTRWGKKMYKVLKGDRLEMEKYRLHRDDYEGVDAKFDYNRYLNDVRHAIATGKPIPMTFGIEGIRVLAKEQRIDDHTVKWETRMNMRKNFNDHIMGEIVDGYFPHITSDKALALKSLNKAVKQLQESGLPKKEKAEQIRKMILKHYSLTGDYHLRDIEENELWESELQKVKRNEKEFIDFQSINATVGSMYSRETHLSGWDTSSQSFHKYMKGITEQYFRQVASMLGRSQISKFKLDVRNKWSPEVIDKWEKFFQLYVQRSMGFPNVIPEYIYNDKGMNLKGTPYAWWADNRVKNRINSISKALNIQDKNLPESLRGITHNQLRHWSNIEARYETASLLAHPKSGLGNIWGGTTLTIQSAGLTNWKDGRNYNYLKNNVDHSLDSRDSLNKFAIKHGVLEDFLQHEASLNPHFKGTNFKRFFEEAVEKILQNPNLKDSSLMSIAEKHQINESLFQKAAYFMKISERMLRVDSFMAHYVQAHKNFRGAIEDYEHPFLINLAKKGVKSTQFLYSSPFRPAFADTALGKVMSRFQLWGWNSVAFRNEVLREAKVKGFQEGTHEFERFKRMAVLDMFSLGLASLFTYSLFESSLPAPYNWMQDTADWMFGDETERDRAFFGSLPTPIAPLQMVMPPAMRMPAAVFKGMLEDDYSRVSDYYIYTMFPFGRIVKDSKGVLENPMYSIEKMTGLPYIKAAQEVKKLGESDDSPPVIPATLFS